MAATCLSIHQLSITGLRNGRLATMMRRVQIMQKALRIRTTAQPGVMED